MSFYHFQGIKIKTFCQWPITEAILAKKAIRRNSIIKVQHSKLTGIKMFTRCAQVVIVTCTMAPGMTGLSTEGPDSQLRAPGLATPVRGALNRSGGRGGATEEGEQATLHSSQTCSVPGPGMPGPVAWHVLKPSQHGIHPDQSANDL